MRYPTRGYQTDHTVDLRPAPTPPATPTPTRQDAARPLDKNTYISGVELRVGVHTGEVELVDNNIGGIAVHLCARIAALGDCSDVLVSSTVKDLTAGSGINYEELGTPELKGIPERWQIFRAQPPQPSP